MKTLPGIIRDALVLTGAGSMVVGLWLISHAFAFVVGGLAMALLGVGWEIDRQHRRGQRTRSAPRTLKQITLAFFAGPRRPDRRQFFLWSDLMNEMIDGQKIRSVGCNPPEDYNKVVHVDASKSLLQRVVGKVFQPAAPPPVARPRPAPLAPAVELEQLRDRLSHYKAQFSAAEKNVEEGHSAPIAGGNVLAQKRRYAERVSAGEDLASEPWIDASLLIDILDDHRRGGLIQAAQRRIHDLERMQAVNAAEADNAPGRKKALARLAKATIELSAAFEAALPFFRFPVGPCLRGVPTDLFRGIHSRLKNVKGPEDLL